MLCTEIRDIPKATFSSESSETLNAIYLRALTNCTNLRSCTWTRESLSSEILEVLSTHCPALRELEINGHATYNPQLLPRFGTLAKISLIMPSADVVDILPSWIENTGKTLTTLHIICQVGGIACLYYSKQCIKDNLPRNPRVSQTPSSRLSPPTLPVSNTSILPAVPESPTKVSWPCLLVMSAV